MANFIFIISTDHIYSCLELKRPRLDFIREIGWKCNEHKSCQECGKTTTSKKVCTCPERLFVISSFMDSESTHLLRKMRVWQVKNYNSPRSFSDIVAYHRVCLRLEPEQIPKKGWDCTKCLDTLKLKSNKRTLDGYSKTSAARAKVRAISESFSPALMRQLSYSHSLISTTPKSNFSPSSGGWPF